MDKYSCRISEGLVLIDVLIDRAERGDASYLFDLGQEEHATEGSPVPLDDAHHPACGLP